MCASRAIGCYSPRETGEPTHSTHKQGQAEVGGLQACHRWATWVEGCSYPECPPPSPSHRPRPIHGPHRFHAAGLPFPPPPLPGSPWARPCWGPRGWPGVGVVDRPLPLPHRHWGQGEGHWRQRVHSRQIRPGGWRRHQIQLQPRQRLLSRVLARDSGVGTVGWGQWCGNSGVGTVVWKQ